MKTELLKTLLKNVEIKSENVVKLLDCIEAQYQENALCILLDIPRAEIQPFETKTFPDTEYFKNIKVFDMTVNYLRNDVTVKFEYNRPSDNSDTPKVCTASRDITIDFWNKSSIIKF